MVLVGCRREEIKQQVEPNKKNSAMAMGPEKSRSLHNFSLPCLRWGSRRQLRCVKDNGDGGSNNNNSGGGDHFPAVDRRSPASSSKSSYHHHNESAARLSPKPPLGPERKRRSFADTDSGGKRSTMSRDQNSPVENGRKSSSLYSSTDDNNGIEAMRKKLVLDLQTQMDKMKFAVLNNNYKKKVEKIKTPAAPVHSLTPKTNSAAVKTAEEDEARPWNLRTRRAVCKEPNGSNNSVGGICGGYKELRIDERKPNLMATVGSKSSARRRSDGGVSEYIVGEKRPRPSRPKFSVGLSKQEIEEDFIAIMGTRPPKRPKKRPRAVQKQVDAFYPGLWLTEISADMYKVNENSEARKR